MTIDMAVTRHVLMGDPACFHIKHGANPHTRNRWGFKKKVDRIRACEQWHGLKERLEAFGVRVHVIPADEARPGLVFPANAGFVTDLDTPRALEERQFILSTLNPARTAETAIYRDIVTKLGMTLHSQAFQFEGQADLIQWGERYLFTYGPLSKMRLVPAWDCPPWRWLFGFRTDQRALQALAEWIPLKQCHSLKLRDERFYHGDTVFCSFGPQREFLLLYQEGLELLPAFIKADTATIIPISRQDAVHFAANSFQLIHQGQCVLLMPAGISRRLKAAVEAKEVHVEEVDVSEFLEKGGGAIKCMICDLGATLSG